MRMPLGAIVPFRTFLLCDVMHKCGLCRHAVSVRPSVTFVDSVEMNVFKMFSPLGSYTILVFPYQMAWQYSDGGIECMWNRQK